ncbi:MAG: DUF1573 domain-containing protein [Bacteroidales bacterium]|nr:DUF1573 domain-containing protein [Bacteroidales bacterium]MCB9013194.1 DUF1573 domain-containing protein [Bacteroidales bacterium]
MKKILFLVSLVAGTSLMGVQAQSKSAAISFNELSYNFADVDESGGLQVHKFEFTNTGGEALIIQNVSTSCGCTTPEWTKEPVKPGQKGYVSAAYNPLGRPGPFEKYITVQSNAEPAVVKLTITGKVTPKPLSIEDEYKFAFGQLRTDMNHLSFGTVYKGQVIVKEVSIINTSNQPMTVKLENVPPHLSVKAIPSTLAPNQKGIFEITYNSAKINDWGFLIDRMDIYVNGTTENSFKLIVSANLEEDFSNITPEQKAKAPKINFASTTFDFGTIKQGAPATYDYQFKNDGKSNLMIRKVTAACGCTAVNTSADMIPPGGSGTIKATFSSAGKMGQQNKTITVITNDPENPKVILWIKGEVTE